MLLGDRNFPIHTATGAVDSITEQAVRAVMDLNPAIDVRDTLLAIWEEGAKLVAARAQRKQLPARFGKMKAVVKAPKLKLNPRPIK